MENIEKIRFAESMISQEGKELGFEDNPELARHIVDLVEQQYDVSTELGKGKSGEVWIGDLPTMQEVCIKIIHDPTISPNSLEREFMLQDKAAQAGVRTAQPWLYVEGNEEQAERRHTYQALAMETLHGRNMQEQLDWMHKNGKQFSVEEYKAIVADIKEQIAILHSANIRHRDLHFGNIYLGDDGKIRIIDFGHAIDASGVHDEDELHRHMVSRNGKQIMETYRRDEQIISDFSKAIVNRNLVRKRST